MRTFYLVILFCCCILKSNAQQSLDTKSNNQAGYIVHLLNYLGNDYSHAVANGKVLSANEYEEMSEFAHSIDKNAQLLNPKDSLAKIATSIKNLVAQKAEPTEVKLACESARKLLIQLYQVKSFPPSYPSISKGAVVFAAECAKCHGEKGFGDGKDGLKLDPKPRNFHDTVRMKSIAPFSAFNTIKYGIEGTGMKSHQNLGEEQIWNLAFYVLSLRYQPTDKVAKTALSLEAIATKSDDEIQTEFPDANIAAIRTAEPNQIASKGFDKSFSYLDEAKNACLNGDLETVDKMITMAYLEGIEPKESIIKELNPELIPNLEKKIAAIRANIKAKNTAEVMANIKLLESDLKEIDQQLKGTNMKPYVTLVLTSSILLREGIEALLIIIIFMNVLGASHFKQGKKYVHLGWLSALAAGVLIWLLIGNLIASSKLNLEILEGSITMVAIALMIYVGFWLHKKSSIEDWKSYIQNKIKGEKKFSSIWGIFSLTFLVVFREIFESILFISSIDLQSKGEHRSYIIIGCIIGFVVIIACYQIVTRLSKNIPFKKLINFSLFILAILTVMLIGKAFHSFQEAGLISQTVINIKSIDVLGIYPTFETLAAQLIMLLSMMLVYFRMSRS